MHDVFITIDVDWAPDWAMRRLLESMLEAGVRSTWFITHETEVLDDLRRHPDRVELGIHPNFQSGSSHGDSPSQVIAECMRMVPEARTMRAHCLVQSTPILQTVAQESPIVLDTSIYLRDARGVAVSRLPLDGGRSIVRAPYVWEDDLEFFAPNARWDGRSFLADRDAAREVTIVDLHPIHFVLNSHKVDDYSALKSAVGDTRKVSERDVARFAHDGAGTATFTRSLAASRNEGYGFERRLVDLAS
jgi:hypothetical protein